MIGATCLFCSSPVRPDASCVGNCWRSRLYCTTCGSRRRERDGDCMDGCRAENQPEVPEPREDGLTLAVLLLAEMREALLETHAALTDATGTRDAQMPVAMAEMLAEHDRAIDAVVAVVLGVRP